MTRLASTAWTSTLLGLAFTSAAVAQTAPEDTTKRPGDTTTTTPSDTTTTTTVTTPAPTPPPAAPAEVNVNVQPEPVRTDMNDYAMPERRTEYHSTGPLSGIGIGIAAGGGTSGFVGQGLRDTTNVGGDWDVRATIGTRSPLAFEGSYIGSAQSIDALGLDNNAVLVGNGVQGALRLKAPIPFAIQPFAFAGVGWRRYDLTNTNTNLSDVNGSDDVLEVPLGVGIGGSWNGLMLDARGEYRVARDANLLPKPTGAEDRFEAMNRWGVKGSVGIEF